MVKEDDAKGLGIVMFSLIVIGAFALVGTALWIVDGKDRMDAARERANRRTVMLAMKRELDGGPQMHRHDGMWCIKDGCDGR